MQGDCIEIKNKEWKAGEKPEEKSLRSTLTYFKGDYFLKKDKACGEFYCNAMVFSTPKCEFYHATETPGGAAVIL